MADKMFSADVDTCWTDRRLSPGQTETNPLSTPANYASGSAIDARLTAISATSYSASRLRTMTLNDKVYALRLADDPTSI